MRPRSRNYRYTLLLVASLALPLLAACGSPGNEGTQATPTSTAKAAPSGEVSFQVFGEAAELSVFQAVVDGYKTANPNVKVNINAVPSQGDHMTKLSSSFAAGNPPDVFLLNYRRYGQFAAKNVLEPLGNWFDKSTVLKASDYYKQSLDAFSYKGTLQCMPQNLSSLGVYYNKDLFVKYNVPLPTASWTWNEFATAASKLTFDSNGDGSIDIYGLGVEPQLIRLAPFVWSNGGEIVDNQENPTKLTLDTPEAMEAVRFFIGLSADYRVVPTEPEIKAEALDARFMNGKLGMFVGSRVDTPAFRKITGFTWDVAPMPRNKVAATILHSDAYCMAAASKNKEAAWDFIEYALGEKGQTIATELGRLVPSLKSVAQSTTFLDPAKPPANSKMYLDIADTIRLVPVSRNWPAVETVVNNELERAFFGLISVDEAVRLSIEKANAEFAK